MRILHIVLTPRHSGAEILSCNLAEIHSARGNITGIMALNPRESAFEPIVASLLRNKVWFFDPARRTSRFGRIRLIRKAYRDFSPDIVVAHSVIPALYARLVSRFSLRSVPVIAVLHSATNDDYASLPLYLSEKILRSAAAAVVTVTEAARKNYAARFGARKRLTTIANGTDIARFGFSAPARKRGREEFCLDERTTVLLQVGRVTSVKGQLFSVLALKQLVGAGHDVILWFAGIVEDHAYQCKVVAQIAEFGLTERVMWLGARSDVEVLLSSADIYLMPSEREAHSVAMIEALASGIPVVASRIDVFAWTDVFEGVDCIEPHDSKGYASAVEIHIGQSGRYVRDLETFSLGHVAKRYADLFADVLDGCHANATDTREAREVDAS